MPGMPGTFSPPARVSDPDMHHDTCVTHVPWCMPGSRTCGFLWIRCRGKHSQDSRRMRNPQFYVYMVRGPLHVPNVIIIVLNPLRPRQNGHQFTDDIIKYIFLNENVWVSIKISLEFVPRGPVNNIPVLVQIMTWRRPGDKPLSEPMGASSLTHICVSRPRWVKAWETNSGVSLLHFMAKYGLFTCVHHFYLLEKNYNMSDISAIHVWHSNGIHLSLIFRHSFFDFFSNTHFPVSVRISVFNPLIIRLM